MCVRAGPRLCWLILLSESRTNLCSLFDKEIRGTNQRGALSYFLFLEVGSFRPAVMKRYKLALFEEAENNGAQILLALNSLIQERRQHSRTGKKSFVFFGTWNVISSRRPSTEMQPTVFSGARFSFTAQFLTQCCGKLEVEPGKT